VLPAVIVAALQGTSLPTPHLAESGGVVAAPRGPAGILLVVLDTVRQDHLSLYGYERPTSPNLDRLAATSLVFENAYSTSHFTLPAHASLFTGKLPSVHGAGGRPMRALAAKGTTQDWLNMARYPLRDELPTLAEELARRGYI